MVSTGETSSISLQAEIAQLRQEHHNLDEAIAHLQQCIANNHIEIQRLKKKKLHLKDRIAFLEDSVTPDIIA